MKSWLGLDGEDFSPENCKYSRRTGGSRMVIYGGDFEGKENPVKAELPIDHKTKGREHLSMVLKKFERSKCLAFTILAKVNEKPVVAIVDTGVLES